MFKPINTWLVRTKHSFELSNPFNKNAILQMCLPFMMPTRTRIKCHRSMHELTKDFIRLIPIPLKIGNGLLFSFPNLFVAGCDTKPFFQPSKQCFHLDVRLFL